MTSDVYFAATFTDIVIQATLASSRRSTTTATARSSSSSTAASTRPVSSLPATTSSSATWRSGLSSYSPRVNSVTSSSPPLPVSWTTRRPAGLANTVSKRAMERSHTKIKSAPTHDRSFECRHASEPQRRFALHSLASVSTMIVTSVLAISLH